MATRKVIARIIFLFLKKGQEDFICIIWNHSQNIIKVQLLAQAHTQGHWGSEGVSWRSTVSKCTTWCNYPVPCVDCENPVEWERGTENIREENPALFLAQHRAGHTPGSLSPCHMNGWVSKWVCKCLGWHPHLCIAPTADGPSPVWDIDAVWVSNQPVVILSEVGARVLRHRAIDIVEHRCLVPIHVQLVEPGPRLSEEHSGSNLNRAQENKACPEGEWKLQPSSGQGKVSNFRWHYKAARRRLPLGARGNHIADHVMELKKQSECHCASTLKTSIQFWLCSLYVWLQ